MPEGCKGGEGPHATLVMGVCEAVGWGWGAPTCISPRSLRPLLPQGPSCTPSPSCLIAQLSWGLEARLCPSLRPRGSLGAGAVPFPIPAPAELQAYLCKAGHEIAWRAHAD